MTHLSDLDIASRLALQPIKDIAASVGISEDALEPYGHYKVRIDINKITPRENKGKAILVTAMSPTPTGEGESTVIAGLADAFHELNKDIMVTLREPVLGPTFGVKGGATDGGYVQVLPMGDISLHFSGDFHAIITANNALSAFIGNRTHQGNELGIDQRRIEWKRVLDMNDRALRRVNVGLGESTNGIPREGGFSATVTPETTTILCLSRSIKDLKDRISRITVGYTRDRRPVTIADLRVGGALAMILKDAIEPSLVQSVEGTPALVHSGPFANTAHGCNSILATETARDLADIVVTEAESGSDLGAEKFMDTKMHEVGFDPAAVVVVATIRALKMHGDIAKGNLEEENVETVKAGTASLERHVSNIKKFGVEPVIAISASIHDTDAEVEYVKSWVEENNVRIALTKVWEKGGKDSVDLTNEVLEIIDQPNSFKPLYELELPLEQKIEKIMTEIYGGSKVMFNSKAQKQLKQFKEDSWDNYPVCMTKTQYSFPDDQTLLGAPPGFGVTTRELEAKTGVGFIIALTGAIMTMPGLPKKPAALDMGVIDDGHAIRLF